MPRDEQADDKPGILKRCLAAVSGLLSALYLANLPAIPPEIPDLLPLVGNIDEFLASAVLLWSLRTWGVRPSRLLMGGRARKELPAAGEREDAT